MIKKLKELEGYKQHSDSLDSMGIRTVEDLQDAFADDDKVDQLLEFLDTDAFDAWEAAIAEEVEIVESEVEEEEGYKVKAKPELDESARICLEKRNAMSARRPAFKRQEWFRYKKLGEKWRRPKGIHSKMRRHIGYRPPIVSIGFRGPADARGLHPSGFEEVMVHNTNDLNGVDARLQAVRIGGKVGFKKRLAIEDKADELGIRVLNRTG